MIRERARWLWTTVFLLTLPQASVADFAQGLEHFQKGDHVRAAVEFLIAAEKGDARAQLNLGLMYDEGLGVNQSFEDAAIWYDAAAKQGVHFAMFNLGSLYFEGLGVAQDYSTAFDWYRKAAQLGNPTAQYNLSVMFEEGRGTLLDYVNALAWLQLAKRNGALVQDQEIEKLRVLMTPDELVSADALFESLRRQTPLTDKP